MSLRFLSPTVVTNECDRIWRGSMLAGIVVCAVAVLPIGGVDHHLGMESTEELLDGLRSDFSFRYVKR